MNFFVKITSNGQFVVSQDSVTSSATTAFVLGTWTMVFVSYSYSVGGYGASNIYLNGIRGPSAITTAGYGSSVFSTSDRVTFGEGFLGQIRRIQVYSPAAFRLNPTPCDSTTCSLDIGFTIPATCMQAVCTTSGTYTSFGSCESILINKNLTNLSQKIVLQDVQPALIRQLANHVIQIITKMEQVA